MLTRDLLRASVRGASIHPSFIDPERASLHQAAQDLIEIWANALQDRQRRGEIADEVKAWIGTRRDHKILKGLAKILFDHSDFEMRSPLPPKELRAKVFRTAREVGPLALEPGPLGRTTAEDVLRRVAEELACDAEDVREALYADLRDQERLVGFRGQDAAWLLDRYNVALVQSLLLHATDLRLRLSKPSQPRLQQLVRIAKFHQLMIEAEHHPDHLSITFDGPASLLRQSTRYGMELASFFPAILLQECPWELHATVLWTKARHPKSLVLDNGFNLKSHRVDTGAYRTREQEAFSERFYARQTPWRLHEGDRPLPLGDRAVLVPDFRLAHPDGREAWLEIIGFWRPETLSRKLERIQRYGPGNVIVAVSKRRRGSKGSDLPAFSGPLIPFAEIVPTTRVIEAAEQVAQSGPT
ncbi:MAG: DUF790 family protein [Deltaproteobacteria bacterium]|nr:MAG: DUF790 family protein [Deltaproteobacteria bacterium]